MSHSRRKTPIVGMTTSDSEKEDKQRAHRRARHTVKRVVRSAARSPELGDETALSEPEHPKSGRWTFAKDGKAWIGKRHPELLRK